MGIRFELNFDHNPLGIYYAGQIVKGRAVIHLEENILVKGVKLRMRGYAKVRWNEHSRNTDPKNNKFRSDIGRYDEERFFENTTDCISNNEVISLAAGTHTYTFECQLPLQCPSTFEGTFGRIRYDTKIIVERPFKFDKTHSMELNVLQLLDLNRLPVLRIPAKMEDVKYFCCGPCISKPLLLSLGLPRTGYVPGEFINFVVTVVNHNLVRNGKWTEKIAIAKKDFGPFGTDDFEIQDTIQVPPTPTTSEEHCKVIKIIYEIEVKAKYDGVHKSSVISIPVTVGNIPFVENLNDISEDTRIAILRNGIASRSHYNPHFEMPSPSYEKAIYVNSLRPTILKQPLFVPRYPFYKNY